MTYKYTIPTLFILSSITLTQPATGQGLSCNPEIDAIGEKITVLIDNGKHTGSGTLVKKEGNLYTVLTSFHNFQRNLNITYTIVTHDGQRYPLNVRNLKPLRDGLDLTEVKFRSNRDYRIAKIGNSDNLKRRDNIYVAGFLPKKGHIAEPFYNCFGGKLLHKSKLGDGGYHLKYSNTAIRGMSGGPVLNESGELIGVHGLGDGYEDNQSINVFSGVPINLYLQLPTAKIETNTITSRTQPVKVQDSYCKPEIDTIAEKITVLVYSEKYHGSGTLVKKEGNIYTVLSNFHLFRNIDLKYTIVTHDGQRYPLYPLNLKQVNILQNGVDLAEVKFLSNRDYTIAKMGNSDDVNRRDNIYVAGFFARTDSFPVPYYNCINSQVVAHTKLEQVDGGTNLLYNAYITRGTSGGPLLNQKGELIGIHTRGERYMNSSVHNRGMGIPINIYLQIIRKLK